MQFTLAQLLLNVLATINIFIGWKMYCTECFSFGYGE